MTRRWSAVAIVAAVMAAGCGDSDSVESTASTGGAADVQIVVSTGILGDVVQELMGDLAEVTVLMPVGSDPHTFQPSARQVQSMTDADALIVNGAGFEAGLVDPIEATAASGVPLFEAISAVPTLALGAHAHDHDEHDDDEHADDEHADDEHGDDETAVDPHFFTDPARMRQAASAIADFLVETVPALDGAVVAERATAYLAELEALDAEVDELLAAVPAERRILVTNHEVFAYFADRYGFEVVGAVIPGGTTGGANAADLAELAEIIEHEGVPAIFVETTSPAELAHTLAAEVDGEVEIVELFTESLGGTGSGGESYVDMMRTDATRIAEALS